MSADHIDFPQWREGSEQASSFHRIGLWNSQRILHSIVQNLCDLPFAQGRLGIWRCIDNKFTDDGQPVARDGKRVPDLPVQPAYSG